MGVFTIPEHEEWPPEYRLLRGHLLDVRNHVTALKTASGADTLAVETYDIAVVRIHAACVEAAHVTAGRLPDTSAHADDDLF